LRLIRISISRGRFCHRLFQHDALGDAMGLGEVDEAHGDAALQRVADGAPLGGELGEGPVAGAARLVGVVDQEGDGRAHLLVRGQREERVGLRRSLYEDRVGRPRLQRAPQRARRPRPMVPYPEDADGHLQP
jgi:hypothetical protein